MKQTAENCRELLADRLEESGLSEERFIDVEDGDKGTYDHTQHTYDAVSGNYGVYGGDGLAILDIDDYNDGTDTDSLLSVLELPDTFTVESPHTDGDPGGHRLYHVQTDREVGEFDVDEVLSRYIDDDGEKSETYHAAKDDPVALTIAEEFGVVNLDPSWGEIRVANQYTVGPGSQIDGCTKDGCDECAKPDGGKYTVADDREIAPIDASELVDVIKDDPVYSEGADDNQQDLESVSYDENEHIRSLPDDADEKEILEYALEESNDDKLRRLWKGDYSDYGGDRSRAESALAYKLAFWLNGDKNAVRRAMDRANTKKWSDRTDSSYRNSVLDAVDKQTEFFEPDSSGAVVESAPTYDAEEVERGEEILKSETSPESPAGELVHRNGHYGFNREVRDSETGEVKRIEFDQVTNFTLETLEELTLDDGRTLLKIEVHPAHPTEDSYEVEVHPTAFNEARTFKEEIVRGRTTTFDPQGKSQQALNDLKMTVGAQLVARRRGVEHIGLAGDEYDEWVTPAGVITADGVADDPDHSYYSIGGGSDSVGGAVARKWALEPDTVGEYDTETVARILELFPQTRRMERGVPVLGWFYAAPLRPLIHEWTGEFNLLQVVGVTGTGKTTFLQSLIEAFGMDREPFDADSTAFTHLKHLSESNGAPVWIDEYKPADMKKGRLEALHRFLRGVTRNATETRGRADQGENVYRLTAPTIVSGEQKFSSSIPAVRRRAIMTNLSKRATAEDSSYVRAFAKLTGRETYENADGETVYHDGYDLEEHARAYYQFVLETPNEELKDLWETAGEDTKERLSKLGVGLENTERQGAQTILFGIRLYRRFAESVGADTSVLPTDTDVTDAFEHIASNIGKNGQRRGYADAFLELFAQAAAKDGYVERGEDYRIMESRKFGGDVLAFHMPSVYSAVKKYVRDFNLDDEYNVIGKNDYIDEFKDKIERGGSYAEATNHATRIGGDRSKCVVIDHEYAAERLGSDFELRAFGLDVDDDDESAGGDTDDPDGSNPPADTDDSVSIAELEEATHGRTPYVTVTAEVVTWSPTEEEVIEAGGPCETGTIKDETGVIDVVDFPGCSYDAGPLEANMTVRIENARVSKYEGTLQLEFVENLTEVTSFETSGPNTTLATAADGGTGTKSESDESDENGARDDSESNTPEDTRDAGDDGTGTDAADGDPEAPSGPHDDVQCRNCGRYWNANPDDPTLECSKCGTPVDWGWNVETGRIPESKVPEQTDPDADDDLQGDDADDRSISTELPDTDAEGALANARRLYAILKEERDGRLSEAALAGRAGDRFDLSPDDVDAALEKGCSNGLFRDCGGGEYERL